LRLSSYLRASPKGKTRAPQNKLRKELPSNAQSVLRAVAWVSLKRRRTLDALRAGASVTFNAAFVSP
jgi:hypothetical protein